MMTRDATASLIGKLRALYRQHCPAFGAGPSDDQRDDSADALLSMLRAAHSAVRHEIGGNLAGRGSRKSRGRGRFRRELSLSWRKLRAFQAGDCEREEVLERVLVWLMSDAAGSGWYNQFAPAAGLCGGNRTAADIVRGSHVETGGTLDIFELKEWLASGLDAEPLWAALKAFSYNCMLADLVGRGIEPYAEWRMPAVRLWVVAPAAYFARLGGTQRVSRQLTVFGAAVDRLRSEDHSVGDVSLAGAIGLDDALDLDAFRGYFDWQVVGELILQQEDAGDPGGVLLPDRVADLRHRVISPFAVAGLWRNSSEVP